VIQERDDNYDPTWMTFVLQRRGSCWYNIDVMVSANKILREELRVVTTHLELRIVESTRLILWGMNDDGTTDLESIKSGLSLHNLHASPLMDKRMGDVWEMIKTQREIMHDHWTSTYDQEEKATVHREHHAIRTILLCLVD